MDKKVAALINDQINKELYSAYLYLDFANYYGSVGLDGFANWYQVQAQEERDHAMLFVQYMQNNDLPITFEAIDKPDLSGLKENIDPLKAALKHEQYVTELIHTIYDAAAEAKTHSVSLRLTASSQMGNLLRWHKAQAFPLGKGSNCEANDERSFRPQSVLVADPKG